MQKDNPVDNNESRQKSLEISLKAIVIFLQKTVEAKIVRLDKREFTVVKSVELGHR